MLVLFFMTTIVATSQCGVGCTISGSSTIPSNTNRTYSVPSSSGFSYFWSVTGGLAIVGTNTGSSVTVRGNSNGTVYITKFRAGTAPCCASRNITVTGTSCGVTLGSVTELNVLGQDNLAFFTVPNLQSGWSITSSSFSVTFQSNNTSNFIGTLNPNGFPQIIIPVPCNDRVKRVSVTVNASAGSTSCLRTVTTNFQPPVCGTGGIGIGFKTTLENDKLIIDNAQKEPMDVLIYNLSGILELEYRGTKNNILDIESLVNGIYILKTINKNGETHSKKIVVE